jgi:prepilin-type N-terminal cleavage/methylation domain-containing protein
MERTNQKRRGCLARMPGGASRGFTLIELVLVIAILGVLAVAALPVFFGATLTSARTSAMNGVVGAVQSGISLYAANQVATGAALSYPATLDSVAVSTACSNSAPCFATVLQNGVTTQWFTSSTAKTYCFDTAGGSTSYATCKVAGTCWVYTTATGTFVTGACP